MLITRHKHTHTHTHTQCGSGYFTIDKLLYTLIRILVNIQGGPLSNYQKIVLNSIKAKLDLFVT